LSVGAAELAGTHGADSRRERVLDEELGLAAMYAISFRSSRLLHLMSGNTTRLGVGLASTSRSAGVRGLRIADTASASHGGNDGFPQRPSQGGTKRLILTTSELRHLRFFIAVAEAGGLTLGAKNPLHTTQPFLSRQIRDLELEVVPMPTRNQLEISSSS